MATTVDSTTVSKFFHPTSRAKVPARLPALEPMAETVVADSPTLAALRSLYFRPGPYVSVNVTVHSGVGPAADSIHRRWNAIDLELQQRKISPLVIEEVAQRVLAKPPAWAASLSVLAASDGTVVAGHGPEPFFADMVVVDTLPHVVPLVTWSQRRGPHLVMAEDATRPGSVDETGGDQDERFIRSLDLRNEETLRLTDQRAEPTRLVLLGQPAATRPLAEMIASGTNRRFQVVSETRLLDVSRTDAGRTRLATGHPHGQSTEVVHQSVVHLPGPEGDSESVTTVLDRIHTRSIDVLVVPADDTLDQRRVWVGALAGELSLQRRRGHDHQARLVDAAIRAAMVGGISVVVKTDTDRDPCFAA